MPPARPLSNVPKGLIVLRALLGPLALWLALEGARAAVVTVLTLAVLSDIFDGVIARRLHVVTASLRIADSLVDRWYFLWLAATVWLIQPRIVSQFHRSLLFVLGLQACSYLLAWHRYGRVASFHAYTAKLWGGSLYIAAVALLGWGVGGWYLRVAILMGALSSLEGMAMTLLLPEWVHDVTGLKEAIRLRREYNAVLPDC